MKIEVRDESCTLIRDADYDDYTMQDGVEIRHLGFRCQHNQATVSDPCCDGRDCGCGGGRSVYCPDCRNNHLTDEKRLEILGFSEKGET